MVWLLGETLSAAFDCNDTDFQTQHQMKAIKSFDRLKPTSPPGSRPRNATIQFIMKIISPTGRASLRTDYAHTSLSSPK